MNEERPIDPFHQDEVRDDVAPADGANATTGEPVTTPPSHRHGTKRLVAVSAAAVLVFAAGAGTGVAGVAAFGGSSTTTSIAQGTTGQGGTAQGGTGSFGGGTGTLGGGATQNGSGSSGFGGVQGGFGGMRGGFGGSGSTGTSSSSGTVATAAQTTGVVTIVSALGYESGESAGTGIILTSSGEILTNNHVIDGATAISVTDESTGRTYSATVVGTNATKDIAVLQLKNASGLTPAALADTAAAVNDQVTAVGNAGGTGTLTAAEGTVTAVGQTITTSAEGATAGETLHGLIETDADVVSGDSGGPLRNADGDVVGIDTAASSGTANPTGYAIPISTALDVATDILKGQDTAEITIGYPAFLGVALSSQSDSPVVSGVFDNTPAATAGIGVGSTITKVGGTSITTEAQLRELIAQHEPGESISITWTTRAGVSHTATVTLIEGPAN